MVAWKVDGVVQPNETQTQFTLETATVDDGLSHTVEALTADRTAFVLPNYAAGQARLLQTVAWELVP